MKHRKKIHTILSASLISSILLSNNIISFATSENIEDSNIKIEKSSNTKATATSGKRYFTVYGKQYHNYTQVRTVGSNRATGMTTIMANQTVPTGYMGVHCNLYNASTDKVVKTSDWTTNNSPAAGYSTNATIDRVGRYYTKGTTKAYNGNGYTVYGAYQSPELSTGSRHVKLTRDTVRGYFNINKNGQTYGTYITDEIGNLIQEPDLMEAVGENNIEGYVKRIDLYDEQNTPNTPEEFITMQKLNTNNKIRVIPLYEKDGETIIDEYHIEQGTETIILGE